MQMQANDDGLWRRITYHGLVNVGSAGCDAHRNPIWGLLDECFLGREKMHSEEERKMLVLLVRRRRKRCLVVRSTTKKCYSWGFDIAGQSSAKLNSTQSHNTELRHHTKWMFTPPPPPPLARREWRRTGAKGSPLLNIHVCDSVLKATLYYFC